MLKCTNCHVAEEDAEFIPHTKWKKPPLCVPCYNDRNRLANRKTRVKKRNQQYKGYEEFLKERDSEYLEIIETIMMNVVEIVMEE